MVELTRQLASSGGRQRGVDFLLVKTVRPPSRLFPPKMWEKVVRDCKAYNLRLSKLWRIYLQWCQFQGYHRGGVKLDNFFVDACRLEMLGLDQLCLRLFPSYDVVEVVECTYSHVEKQQGRKTIKPGSSGGPIGVLKNVKVKPKLWPHDEFLLSEGFSEKDKTSGFKQGELVVIEHFGLHDEQRQGVRYLGRASDPALALRANEDKQYQVTLEKTRERAQDSIEEAKEKVEKDIYSVNFCKFARCLLSICAMSYEELARFAAKELFRDNNVRLFIYTLHNGCTSRKDKRLIESLFKARYDVEAKGSTEKDRLISFMERYPIILTPLVLIQRAFRWYVRGKRQTEKDIEAEGKAAYPTKFREAWTYSSRELIRRMIREVDPNARVRAPSIVLQPNQTLLQGGGGGCMTVLKTSGQVCFIAFL